MRINLFFFTVIVLFSLLTLSIAENQQQLVLLNRGNVSEVAYSPDGESLAVAGGYNWRNPPTPSWGIRFLLVRMDRRLLLAD